MNPPIRSLVPEKPFQLEAIAPGVTRRRLYPGGKAGPDGIVSNPIPGGQTWSEALVLGSQDDAFMMLVPDIRMPPNQLWPMHWHDCWTVVVVLEGSCIVGDWQMQPQDAFVAAPGIEYGPLLIGPQGCRLLEIFSDLALAPGGYGPEYRDHPTLRGGNHVFKQREGINRRNEGHSSLSLDGADGMWQSRLVPGWQWDLGDHGDPERPVVRNIMLAPGEHLPASPRGDAYCALLLDGSATCGGMALTADDAVLAERGSTVPEIVAGPGGAQLLENFRTTRAL